MVTPRRTTSGLTDVSLECAPRMTDASQQHPEALEMEKAAWVILLERKQGIRRHRRSGNYKIKVSVWLLWSLQEPALLIL